MKELFLIDEVYPENDVFPGNIIFIWNLKGQHRILNFSLNKTIERV